MAKLSAHTIHTTLSMIKKVIVPVSLEILTPFPVQQYVDSKLTCLTLLKSRET